MSLFDDNAIAIMKEETKKAGALAMKILLKSHDCDEEVTSKAIDAYTELADKDLCTGWGFVLVFSAMLEPMEEFDERA